MTQTTKRRMLFFFGGFAFGFDEKYGPVMIDKTDTWVEIEHEDGFIHAFHWPYCQVNNCVNRICFGISNKFCHPHSGGQEARNMIKKLNQSIKKKIKLLSSLLLFFVLPLLVACDKTPPCKTGHEYVGRCGNGKGGHHDCTKFSCDVYVDCETEWRDISERGAKQCLEYMEWKREN